MKLSFCITCKNRLTQISKTLRKNLDDNAADLADVDFVLMDLGSNDGLQEWIFEHFAKEINTGALKYFHTSAMEHWNCSAAKNAAHRYADGDIVVNLDCDNYTGLNGGRFVLDLFKTLGTKIVIHQGSGIPGDGSFGRIAVLKTYFAAIGGYDEAFLPMGYQDTDLIKRLTNWGLFYISRTDAAYNQAVVNSKQDSIKNTGSGLSYLEMNEANRQRSDDNIIHGITIANNGDYGSLGEVTRLFNMPAWKS